MSFRQEKFLNFKRSDLIEKLDYLHDLSEDEIKSLFHEVLNSGIHGFCFSLYEEGQEPGDPISEEQIHRRIKILKPYTNWVRTFSCTEGNELIPAIAKEHGMNTMVGAWLGGDAEKNEEEIAKLVELCNQGHVDIAAVGNEVLYRNDLNLQELLSYISRVKEQVTHVPVSYVDAYYEFASHPEITELCDVLLCNCYPYWEGTSIEDSLQHMRQMYYLVKSVANGKRVIISETGWPSEGESLGGANPSMLNAMKYFINTNLWSHDEEIEVMYFSSFDESWKVGDEGAVGAYWGIWDAAENLKF